MKIPATTIINAPKIIEAASVLKAEGKLGIINNHYMYLKVDDAFIHTLHPLIEVPNVLKPDYFGAGGVGAHVSVVYPEEKKLVTLKDLHMQHEFTIKHFATAKIVDKLYYAVLVESPTLLAIRKQYQLPELLTFKGYDICFHITIGYTPI